MADNNLGVFRINPRGKYDSTASYRFLDAVSFEGGSYLCKNYDTIDGTACIGILPTGQPSSELYWMCLAEPGATGKAELYQPFITVNDFIWNFDESDKIIIPQSGTGTLQINNVYDGCCGLILTKNKNIGLPANSCTSVDFNYIECRTNQCYMYSFVYGDLGAGPKFFWNRTVINI